MLMDPNNNTIHVVYFVLLSTNPNKAIEYEETIVILLKFLATTAVAVHFHVPSPFILKFATLGMWPTLILWNKY